MPSVEVKDLNILIRKSVVLDPPTLPEVRDWTHKDMKRRKDIIINLSKESECFKLIDIQIKVFKTKNKFDMINLDSFNKYSCSSTFNKLKKKENVGFNSKFASQKKPFKKREYKEKAKNQTYGSYQNFKEAKAQPKENLDEIQIEEGLPSFLQKENIMDKNMRRPTDPDYD